MLKRIRSCSGWSFRYVQLALSGKVPDLVDEGLKFRNPKNPSEILTGTYKPYAATAIHTFELKDMNQSEASFSFHFVGSGYAKTNPLSSSVFVENTLKIIRFISDNKEFKKLNIYNLDINNENDVDRLFEFIKNLVWCNYDEYSLLYVFLIENEENITSDIKDFYDNNWKKLMSNYNKKNRYVRKIVS